MPLTLVEVRFGSRKMFSNLLETRKPLWMADIDLFKQPMKLLKRSFNIVCLLLYEKEKEKELVALMGQF